jgi:hypothetical protein
MITQLTYCILICRFYQALHDVRNKVLQGLNCWTFWLSTARVTAVDMYGWDNECGKVWVRNCCVYNGCLSHFFPRSEIFNDLDASMSQGKLEKLVPLTWWIIILIWWITVPIAESMYCNMIFHMVLLLPSMWCQVILSMQNSSFWNHWKSIQKYIPIFSLHKLCVILSRRGTH